MKKVLFTTLVLILVPSLLFLPMYLLMIHTAKTGLEDYSDDVIGTWSAFQYYYENERFACNDDEWMNVTFSGESIAIEGTILPISDTACTWLSGSSLSYGSENQTTTLFLSFDTQNNLKITVNDTSYIILLRKNVG